MSQSDDDLITEIWAPETFANVFFSPEESQRFLDSFLNENGVPPPQLRTDFIHWILNRSHTRGEILHADPDQLRQWVHRAF